MRKMSELLVSSKTYSKLEQLYSEDELKREARRLGKEKIRLISIAIAVTIIIALAVYIQDMNGTHNQIKSIMRNSYGAGDKSVETIVDIGVPNDKQKIKITVKDRIYNNEELDEYLKETEKRIWSEILGNNKTLDEVTENLNLVKSMDGIPYNISWKSEKPLLISSKGVIDKKALKEELSGNSCEEIMVRLNATLRYEDRVDEIYGYVILKEDRTKNLDKFIEDLRREIEETGNKTRHLEEQLLPTKVNGINVTFYEKKQNRIFMVLCLGGLISFLLPIISDNKIDEDIKKRDRELNEDYPKILNQYVLYYCAGMNTRAIWEEICSRYERSTNNGKCKRWAYEEMVRCKRAMNEGKGELDAYNDFAKKCQLPSYRTFVSLIEQSVKKGNEKLNIALEEELERARKEENNRVRMLIAEMSTKLLGPMIMMLLIVLVIVMVPAFISFNN